MNDEEKNIDEAKKSIKSQIKLLETILQDLKSNKKELQIKSILATWCIHRYISEDLINDIKGIAEQFGEKKH